MQPSSRKRVTTTTRNRRLRVSTVTRQLRAAYVQRIMRVHARASLAYVHEEIKYRFNRHACKERNTIEFFFSFIIIYICVQPRVTTGLFLKYAPVCLALHNDYNTLIPSYLLYHNMHPTLPRRNRINDYGS